MEVTAGAHAHVDARRGARGDESREKVVGDVEEEGNDRGS